MDIIDQLVERRITEAIARGDFEGLPGAGRPLEIDDDRLVPEELRVAHRIMKNAGFVPDELSKTQYFDRLMERLGGSTPCW